MKITDIFIRRPVLAVVVNLVILIAGIQSIRSLSVRQYPRSDIAVINVTTVYVGANADLVRGFITTPLERVIASADGIDYIESSSAQSMSTITVHLKLNYDTNAALTQIQAKVAQVRNTLPPEAEAPIIDLQTADNRSMFSTMTMASSTRTRSPIISRVWCSPSFPRWTACSAPTSWAAARLPCGCGSNRSAWPRWAFRPRMCARRWPRTPVDTRRHQGNDDLHQPGGQHRPQDHR